MSGPSEAAGAKAAAAYNAAADNFDGRPLAFWDRYGRKTIERLKLAPGARILDAGCGSGASAIPAGEAVGSAGHVIGIDLAERLLALGRDKAQRSNLQNVEFRLADMEASGFPDASFDAVVCVFAVFFVPDMTRLVRELWRMVRPRGLLAITTWGPGMFEPGSAAWWSAVERLRPDLVSAFKPWERLITPESVSKLFADSGIEDVEIVAESGHQALASADDWWTVVLGSGYRWTVEQMDADTLARVREANIGALKDRGTTAIETNVIYAVAKKFR